MSRRFERDGPIVNVMTRSGRCLQVYRTRSRVTVLMKNGVPCNEDFVASVKIREPRLPFTFGRPTQ